jgi:hypothetical protein
MLCPLLLSALQCAVEPLSSSSHFLNSPSITLYTKKLWFWRVSVSLQKLLLTCLMTEHSPVSKSLPNKRYMIFSRNIAQYEACSRRWERQTHSHLLPPLPVSSLYCKSPPSPALLLSSYTALASLYQKGPTTITCPSPSSSQKTMLNQPMTELAGFSKQLGIALTWPFHLSHNVRIPLDMSGFVPRKNGSEGVNIFPFSSSRSSYAAKRGIKPFSLTL